MKVLAVYNIKGGVGKTATAVNLSYLSALGGKRTLLCDFDPQGASSYYLQVDRKRNEMRPKKFWQGGHFAQKQIKDSKYDCLDVLPAHQTFRNLDLLLSNEKKSKKKISSFLERFTGQYDIIIIDAPPNLTLLSENLFRGADIVLVPLIPTTLSMRTFQQIKTFFTEEGLPLNKLRAFFSMVENRKKLHKEIIDESPATDGMFIPIDIPMAAIVEKMGIYREPLAVYAPNSLPAIAYQSLWKWIDDSWN